jgi:hypothetical protein
MYKCGPKPCHSFISCWPLLYCTVNFILLDTTKFNSLAWKLEYVLWSWFRYFLTSKLSNVSHFMCTDEITGILWTKSFFVQCLNHNFLHTAEKWEKSRLMNNYTIQWKTATLLMQHTFLIWALILWHVHKFALALVRPGKEVTFSSLPCFIVTDSHTVTQEQFNFKICVRLPSKCVPPHTTCKASQLC